MSKFLENNQFITKSKSPISLSLAKAETQTKSSHGYVAGQTVWGPGRGRRELRVPLQGVLCQQVRHRLQAALLPGQAYELLAKYVWLGA